MAIPCFDDARPAVTTQVSFDSYSARRCWLAQRQQSPNKSHLCICGRPGCNYLYTQHNSNSGIKGLMPNTDYLVNTEHDCVRQRRGPCPAGRAAATRRWRTHHQHIAWTLLPYNRGMCTPTASHLVVQPQSLAVGVRACFP